MPREDIESPGTAWDLARGQGNNSGIVPGRDEGGSPAASLASGLSAVGTWVVLPSLKLLCLKCFTNGRQGSLLAVGALRYRGVRD